MAPAKFHPALMGGLVMGVLSGLPFVNVANCCCLWVIGGGLLAAYIMQQNHPEPVTVGDGAAVGLLAGVIGAVVWQLISITVGLLMGSVGSELIQHAMEGARDVPPEVGQLLEGLRSGTPTAAWLSLVFTFTLAISAVFSTLGGVLGAALFRMKPSSAAPPGTTA
jgi:hypothetical protein